MPITQDILIHKLIHDRAQILAYLRLHVRDADLTDDLFQELSLKAFDNMELINDEAHLNRWLRIVGRNLCMDALKKHSKTPTLISPELIDLIEEQWEQTQQESTGDLMPALRQCMERLSPYARQLIHERYAEGLTGSSLAHAMGRKNANTVYVALSRVHRMLHKCMHARRRQSIGGSHDRS